MARIDHAHTRVSVVIRNQTATGINHWTMRHDKAALNFDSFLALMQKTFSCSQSVGMLRENASKCSACR